MEIYKNNASNIFLVQILEYQIDLNLASNYKMTIQKFLEYTFMDVGMSNPWTLKAKITYFANLNLYFGEFSAPKEFWKTIK